MSPVAQYRSVKPIAVSRSSPSSRRTPEPGVAATTDTTLGPDFRQDDGDTGFYSGKEFISLAKEGKQLAMKVPSAICPTDFNLQLNPLHRKRQGVKIVEKTLFRFDNRLFG